jgi:neprosin-like protein
MRKIVMALVASVSLILGGVVGIAPVQAAVANNALGKPLPALDFAHASKGAPGNKGKFVPITSRMTPKSSCGTCYFYGGGRQTVSTDMASIQFSVEQPSCTTNCGHSLAELAMQSADGQQTVEWGWLVDTTGVNGTDHVKPHLFAFHWVNGVPSVYNGGGWVNAVGSTCPAGMDISADVAVGSATLQNFVIQHLNGAWWTAYKGNWCGAFPDSLWTSPAYTQAGLVQVFGEVGVYDNVPTGVQMGSGVLGAASPSAGARASTFTLGTTVPAGVAPALTMLSNPVPTHYKAILTPPSLRTFRYGGTY